MRLIKQKEKYDINQNGHKSKFNKALGQFVDKHRKNPNVLAILVSGSYARPSAPDKNSDLDIDIVLKKSRTTETGSTWINGVEIEYFKNSVKQIRHRFQTEARDKKPCTAHIFSDPIILYQKEGEIVNQLIKEARSITRKRVPKMNRADTYFARHKIDAKKKDLEDVYLKKDIFTFRLIAYKLILECLDIFYKIKRVPRERPKKLRADLKSLDPKFEALLSGAILEKGLSRKFKAIKKLTRYAEFLAGGKKPKEWKLRTKYAIEQELSEAGD